METDNQDRAVFSKEELEQNVKVPAVVEQDLKRIISDRLEQCGLYYRVFSRIKTAASMARKFERKGYGETHKLQDLVGVRINLYFDDDVDICKDIMEQTFEALEWSTSKRNEDEFRQTKLNGVFKLPEYLKYQISPATWDMYIDDTFEIQIKTMFFEGWHEIEHDMRYKGEELWKDYPGFSRFFNSILATLELCDKSMISLFEDLGHELYKSGNWSDMIRSHFRLKMGDAPMYPEVEALLREDQKQTVDSIAKRIYKTSKRVLVSQLLRRPKKIPINVNTIIALLNECSFHDARLAAIFREQDVYNDGREERVGESRHYEMKALSRQDVFRMSCVVDGSRMKEEDVDGQAVFEKAVGCVYSWIVSKYSPLFPEMPARPETWKGDLLAYHVDFRLDCPHRQMLMHVRHVDLEVGGRVWYSEASLSSGEDQRILLNVRNGFAEPEREHMYEEGNVHFFSYPGYYKAIVDQVGIRSGIDCFNRRRILREEQIEEISQAIKDASNRFPVVVIISKEKDMLMDESWLGQFRVSDFTRTVWRYAHVFTCYEVVGRELLRRMGQDGDSENAVPRLIIFWPDDRADLYGPEDVSNCSFGRHLEARDDARTYDIVHGGQAFYHKIVTDLRDWNVSLHICLPEMV